MLIACAQYPDGADRTQLTILTGYKRSTRDAYIQRLGERRYIETRGGTVVATDAGTTALGADYQPLPTGAALAEHWLDRLGGGEREILALLIERRTHVERGEISSLLPYAKSSRDAYIQRLAARKLVETDSRGTVRAARILFD